MTIQVRGKGEVKVPDCECDPGRKFIRSYLYQAIDARVSSWTPLLDIADEQLFDVIAYLVEFCIDEVDLSEMIRISLSDDTLNSKTQRPFISLPNLGLKKCIKIAWEEELSVRYPSLAKYDCPENIIEGKFPEQLEHQDLVSIQIDMVGTSCGVIGVWLNSKDMAKKCIKWTLDSIPRDVSKPKTCHLKDTVKAEVAMCKSLDPYKVFTSMMISKLLKSARYEICSDSFREIEPFVDESTILVRFEDTQPNSKTRLASWNLSLQWDQGIDSVVIPYTKARIKSILTAYESFVANGEYPPLVPIELVDFSIIGYAKEEVPLIVMLFYWPMVYQYSVNVKTRNQNQIDLLFLIHFIKLFGKKFETFYSRVQVIVPRGSEHSFTAMMARLYLLKAIYKVFEEFTEIFEIDKIGQEIQS